MGALGGMFGLAGGASGTGFAGPGMGIIQNPVQTQQTNIAGQGTSAALNQQQAFLNALQQQGGIQNQSNVYNQLQGIANGTGPNPAQAMLNQATGQNVANQAALAAGQRGAGANVGLMARQAAQQGVNAQQQAAGQGATLQSQQSLGALNQMGGIAGQQVGNILGQANTISSAQQNEQANLLNSINAQNNANVSMQSNINSVNGQLAQQGMQNQASFLGNMMNMGGAGASMLADGGDVQVSVPPIQQVPANPVAPQQKSSSSGGGIGGLMSLVALLAQGGEVQKFQYGGMSEIPSEGGSSYGTLGTPTSQMVPNSQSAFEPQSLIGKAFKSVGSALSSPGQQSKSTSGQQQQSQYNLGQGGRAVGNIIGGGLSDIGDLFNAKGGEVKIIVSPGEKILPPKAVEAVKKGANPMKVGGTVPGKPEVGGAVDSYKNDKVPAKVPPHTIIVPRSSTKSKNPDRSSRDFVSKTLAKRKSK